MLKLSVTINTPGHFIFSYNHSLKPNLDPNG